jgi:hypothetical protein
MILIIVFCLIKEIPVPQVLAAENSTELANTYLNVQNKNLYLGETGNDKFTFKVKKGVLQKGATYQWYVEKDKGNPEAVSINTKTGMVTAENIGTAYIMCKITLTDKTVLVPEATVNVFNNITSVQITNIPENGVLKAGSPKYFSYKVINTTAGKNLASSGIVRWEIAEDTAQVGTATEDGVVTPKQAGRFKIRAVCFENLEDYNAWLTNKTSSVRKITAASNWATITVTSNSGVAATQEQLEKLLKDEYISLITINTETEQKIIIPAGDYLNKTLIVNAPNTDFINSGLFQQITINGAKGKTWEEREDYNQFVLNDCIINLLIAEDIYLQSITLGTNSNKTIASDGEPISLNTVNITNHGTANKLSVQATSFIKLSGDGKIDNFILEKTANGTKIAAYSIINFTTSTDFMITLFEGSEGSVINLVEYSDSIIENLSGSYVEIRYDKSINRLSSRFGLQIYTNGNHKYMGMIKTSSVIKFDPFISSVISTTPISRGQRLWNSVLSGTFTYDTEKVDGLFYWVSPGELVTNDGFYEWMFVPIDSEHFNTVRGTTKVVVID